MLITLLYWLALLLRFFSVFDSSVLLALQVRSRLQTYMIFSTLTVCYDWLWSLESGSLLVWFNVRFFTCE